MNIAYIRVSSKDQNLDRQRMILEEHKIERWYEEKAKTRNVKN